MIHKLFSTTTDMSCDEALKCIAFEVLDRMEWAFN